MVTVMSWRSSGGDSGRCDAKCHAAKEPKCVCMCGGRYHGAAKKPGGLEAAVRKWVDEVIKEAEQRAKEEGVELKTYPLQAALL